MEQSYFNVKDETAAMELLQRNNLLNLKSLEKKRTTVIALDEAAAASEQAQDSDVEEQYMARRNIVDSLTFLTNSISRMLDYYRNNHRNTEFRTIYLSDHRQEHAVHLPLAVLTRADIRNT
jgi:Tfp pilus assembly PilM family ATPase